MNCHATSYQLSQYAASRCQEYYLLKGKLKLHFLISGQPNHSVSQLKFPSFIGSVNDQ